MLVVDDEPIVSDLTCEILNEAGLGSAAANTSTEALQRMGEGPFDAVLMDIHLSDGNGLELLGQFRRSFPMVPVIMLTGDGYDEDLMETARKAGASGYVSKHTEIENILIAVNRVLR